MEHIEFMQRTDNRYLQTHIRYKIREVFRERDEDLNRRRECLQAQLAAEELQQEEEMANLFRARVLENMQKRQDWIATANFERSEAEREFLKLKQIQRELMNCEEMRPRESKKITEETKKVQLLQIAEKRAIEMKEKEIDKIWFEASMCMEKEKEKQQQYENHLKKIIANQTVSVLDGQLEYQKHLKELENEEKKEQNIINEREKNEEALRIEHEARERLSKKIQEGTRLQNELKTARLEKHLKAKELEFFEAKDNELLSIQLQQEQEAQKLNKNLERESSERYLCFARHTKAEMDYNNKKFDDALTAQGSQILPKPISKIPYQKSVR